MIVTVTPNPSVDRTLEVPGFRAGGTFRGRLVALRPAGKGLNVSRCLAALGAPSVATGLVGRGEVARFDGSFAGTLVEPRFVGAASPVRASTTVVDPDAASACGREHGSAGRTSETHVRERGGEVSPGEVDALERAVRGHASPPAGGSPGGWVAACGSLPGGVTASRYARLLAAAREGGARIALDSSGEGLRAAAEVGVDLLKPNRVELAELTGREVGDVREALDAARSLVNQAGQVGQVGEGGTRGTSGTSGTSGKCGSGGKRTCPAVVLVTLGADGALLVDGEGALSAACGPETIVSSVGAGDAALAGYLWAETQGRPRDERLRAAVAAGAASLAEPVAGALDRGRFERLLDRALVKVV